MKRKLSVKNHSLVLAGEFAAFSAGAVILLVFIASTLDASLLSTGQGAAVVTSVLADLANTDRGLNHAGALRVSPQLTAIAQAKANDMAANGYFAHNSPSGKTPWYWFRQEGYSFTYAGENLAIDFSDSAEVEAAWMKSPTHRANLLNGKFTEVGIATAVGTYQGHTTTFVVEEFGTPARTPAPIVAPPPAKIPTPKTPEVVAVETPQVLGAVETPAPIAKTSPPAPRAPHTAMTAPSEAAPAPAITEPAPAPVAAYPEAGGDFLALWRNFAASPKTTMTYAYYLFAFLIMGALVIETGLEMQKRHLRHVAVALCLVALMGTLFITADRLVFTTPVITQAAGGAALGS
jgi:uncharacterized protein YkwD